MKYDNNFKKELWNKLDKMTKSSTGGGLSKQQIDYLKSRVYNKLGLYLEYEDREEDISKYWGLSEIKELNINKKDSKNNLLIEGDNYHALLALKTANQKVDVIYIDPPYNTGNEDFIYNDLKNI